LRSGSPTPKASPKETSAPHCSLARWTLDRNGEPGSHLLPPDDPTLAGLLLEAARGIDVESKFIDEILNYRGQLIATLRRRDRASMEADTSTVVKPCLESRPAEQGCVGPDVEPIDRSPRDLARPECSDGDARSFDRRSAAKAKPEHPDADGNKANTDDRGRYTTLIDQVSNAEKPECQAGDDVRRTLRIIVKYHSLRHEQSVGRRLSRWAISEHMDYSCSLLPRGVCL
jgi:hypothetical protein